MFQVELEINNKNFILHDSINKLQKASLKEGINEISSFGFDILLNHECFNLLYPFKTKIRIFDNKKNKYIFIGRVLKVSKNMDSNGLISKNVVCESELSYLQDSEQDYVEERNWSPQELLKYLINHHNNRVDSNKQFLIGAIEFDDNLYCGIQRESTLDTIKSKIIDKLGAELVLNYVGGNRTINILKQQGIRTSTTIALSKNMKSIKQEQDVSSYISRLIPLGAKIKDSEGNDTETRIDISGVNEGINYIDDEIAISNFGIITKSQIWDDVHEPAILKTKAQNFLSENNKVLQKYSINALDLALIGIDIDTIDVGNYYQVQNKLLNIDESLRVTSKTTDLINYSSTNFEIGDKFKTLFDLEIEKDKNFNDKINRVDKIENSLNDKIVDIKNEFTSSLEQTSESISSFVEEKYTSKSEFEQYQSTISTTFEQTNNSFNMQFNEIIQSITNVDGTVNSNYQELIKYIQFKHGEISLGEVGNPLILKLSNDRLQFLDNGVEVAYISNNKLYVFDGEFLNSLKIGRFIFIPRENGNLSFTFV